MYNQKSTYFRSVLFCLNIRNKFLSKKFKEQLLLMHLNVQIMVQK